MKRINIDEIKKIQLDMLLSIDEFCRIHCIKYSLSSGTLIGAVRHGGYIPWDDDIDIMMPRVDYEQFIYSFNGAFNHLSLLAPELDSSFYAPYANVYDNRTVLFEGYNGHRGHNIGVKIDIFPIDNVSENSEVYIKDMRYVNRLNILMYIKRIEKVLNSKMSFLDKIKTYMCKIVLSFVPYSYLQSKINDVAKNKSYDNSQYVDNVVYNIYYKKHTRFNKSILENYIRIPFEGYDFSVIEDYDTVLKKMYGNYMQLPPECNRIAHHNFDAFWID